jgi:hypothetical protein
LIPYSNLGLFPDFFSKFIYDPKTKTLVACNAFVGLAYQEGKDIVFRFIIEYSSLRNFGPYVIDLFSYEDF